MAPSARTTRLRIGPSPAGPLHVGHVRNAVLTWILARQQSGEYLVRFENTDRVKEVAGAREAMVEDLAWLGLLGDSPPGCQADMKPAYRQALDVLADGGWTYREGDAVRFRLPRDGATEWEDVVRGRLAVRNSDLGDPVLVRSSGLPTFFLASTVDDSEDGITHLLRVDAMARVTATQLHIWGALGRALPRFGHHPAVVGSDRKLIRNGATEGATVGELRESGIAPQVLVVYLALPQTASWKAPPVRLEDVVDQVDLSRVSRRPLVFDVEAVRAMNRRYGAGR
ncbi:MAG TPA: glutamate--tRNA ligase family protein [Acidimicrobiales bacterium]|nr:glutamate--tRNA ligase family protein [Acidimicrobiales bacterium]